MENKDLKTNNFIKETNILTADEFIKIIRDAIKDIERIDNITNDSLSYDIIYKVSDGYGYNISLIDEKKNYLQVDLSFSNMRDLLPKEKIEELRSLIENENKSIRCVKGFLSDNQGKDKNELQFSVSYEVYMYPLTSRDQLSQHIITSKRIIDLYIERTLDVVQASQG